MPDPFVIPGNDVVPGGDSDLSVFGSMVADQWDPSIFGGTAPTGPQMVAAATEFANLLAVATNAGGRTSAAIAAKNAARVALVQKIRAAARLAVAWYRNQAAGGPAAAATAASTLASYGFRAPDDTRTPVPAPDAQPGAELVSIQPGKHRIRLVHMSRMGVPTGSNKFPAGTVGVEIEFRIGDGPWNGYGIRRRVNLVLNTGGLSFPNIVCWRFRYVNAKGEHGPWSTPVCGPIV